jgi:hypothetical protein
MSLAGWKLFAHALHFVTPKDVANYCPNDPGYPGYVREFTSILKSRRPPTSSNFEISETINLTRWGNSEEERDPDRFRRFRIFTNAVAVMLYVGDEGPGDTIPANYICISLLEDALALQDAELMGLLYPAFDEMYNSADNAWWGEDEKPFLILGQLLLALMGHAPDASVQTLCDRLIQQEARCTKNDSGEFLWECTSFGQLHDAWKAHVEIAFPKESDNESLLLLRAMLLG